ncbi:MAG: hypothetical protein GY811_27415, partial [Myxococcales bacterium]|nr:hypothetical protein [Myxococcales bacterium]
MNRFLLPLLIAMAACSSPKAGDTIPADVTGNAITDLADFDAQVMVGQSLRLEGFLFHYTSGERAYEL